MHLTLSHLNILQQSEKTCEAGEEYFQRDKDLKDFLFEISKNGVWEYLVSLPQIENIQNLYPNFSYTVMIVFAIVDIVIIKNFTITQL